MAVLDLDKNGCNDLVISAPTEGSDLLEYSVSPILWRKIYFLAELGGGYSLHSPLGYGLA